MTRTSELAVVVPVFDEEESIAQVLEEWLVALEALDFPFDLRVYDDGSTDRTPAILSELSHRDPRVQVHRHSNRGHGPTLRRAYAEVRAPWVLQIDGDGELPAASFGELWAVRPSYDLVVGRREGRASTLRRRIVSASAIRLTRWLFGSGLRDPNSPYRLMRGEWLTGAVAALPDAPFAPNLLLAGVAARQGARTCELPVPYRGRRAGRGKLLLPKLAHGVIRSTWELTVLALHPTLEPGP